MGRDAGVREGLRAPASRRTHLSTHLGPRLGACRGQRGAATAEAMVVLPVVVAVGLGLVWALGLAVAQVRLVDGAREAARVAARGEADASAAAAARRVAPDGARVSISRGAGVVTAVVEVRVSGPGGIFRIVPGVLLSSRAAAVEEPS